MRVRTVLGERAGHGTGRVPLLAGGSDADGFLDKGGRASGQCNSKGGEGGGREDQWQQAVDSRQEVPCGQSWLGLGPKTVASKSVFALFDGAASAKAEELSHRVRGVGATKGDAAETEVQSVNAGPGRARRGRAGEEGGESKYAEGQCVREARGRRGARPESPKYGVWTGSGVVFDKWGDARASGMELLCPMGVSIAQPGKRVGNAQY